MKEEYGINKISKKYLYMHYRSHKRGRERKGRNLKEIMTKSFPDLKKEMGIHAHKTLDSE